MDWRHFVSVSFGRLLVLASASISAWLLNVPLLGSSRRVDDSEPSQAARPRSITMLGIPFIELPTGSFLMGSTRDQIDQLCVMYPGSNPALYADELPRHRVRIARPVLMVKHEVIVGQFRAFVEANGYQTIAERDGRSSVPQAPRPRCQRRRPLQPVRSAGTQQIVSASAT